MRTGPGRIRPFEPQEAFQRRQEGADGAAQVMGGGAIVSGARAFRWIRTHAATIWKPGVERDKASSSGVISVATPSNSGVDR